MTTKVPAREGLRWFQQAAVQARQHALAWLLRAIALAVGSTVAGLFIGAAFGLLSNVAPSFSPWVVWLVPVATTALTGPLLVLVWWLAMREGGDPLTGQDLKRAMPPAVFWLLAPTLVVWGLAKLLDAATNGSSQALSIAGFLHTLLNLWPLVTVMVGGVLLDQARTRPQEPWYSSRPWGTACRLLCRQWAPLLTGWLVPWLVLSSVFMLIVVTITGILKSSGVPLDVAHANTWVAWLLRLVTVTGLFVIGLVANLALVIGYRRTRGSAPVVLNDATRTNADEESFPPLL